MHNTWYSKKRNMVRNINGKEEKWKRKKDNAGLY